MVYLQRERIEGNVAILPVEPTVHSPESGFQRELELRTSLYSGRIAFSIDCIPLDKETEELVEDTLGLFGSLFLLSTGFKSDTEVDLVSGIRQVLLFQLGEARKELERRMTSS